MKGRAVAFFIDTTMYICNPMHEYILISFVSLHGLCCGWTLNLKAASGSLAAFMARLKPGTSLSEAFLFRDHAKVMVSLLRDMQENEQRATMLQLVDRFRVKMKELGRSNNSISDLKKDELEQLIVQLILDRVLKEEYQHTAYATNAYVALGPLWKQALQGKKPCMLEICTGQHGNSNILKGAKHSRTSDLELKLDELRKELSSSHGGIFPHAVLSAQQISMLSTQKPTSIAQLENLIGKVKTEKYGDRIIDLIQQYIKSELPNGDTSSIAEGNENRENKRPRTNKAVVLVESSEDDDK